MKNFRIGQVVPSSNTTMEIKTPAMLTSRYAEFPDEHFMFHSVRVYMTHVTPKELGNMDMASDHYALELSDAHCGVMTYACLVVIMSQGRGYRRVSQEHLARVTGQNNVPTPVPSSVGALIGAIHVQSYRKAAIITPYVKPLAQTVIDYTEDSGIEVTDSISLEVPDSLAVGRLDPASPVGHAGRLNISGADTVVLSACVQMPLLPSTQVVGGRLDRSVFSAATSTVYQMLKTLGLRAKVPSAGYLLSGAF